jgi:hypothetical protein
MKTKILKAFIISVLVGGTFGSAFAQDNPKPRKIDNKVDCLEAGFYWTSVGCRRNSRPGLYTTQVECLAAGFFWSLNSKGKGKVKCRTQNYVSYN